MAASKPLSGDPLFPEESHEESPEEAASKEEHRRRLAECLKDPQFRQIEGFPIGSDEEILALSDPPYYTACPNPFLPEILEQWQEERRQTRKKLGIPEDDARYHREPFAADVSEGKNDPIYNAHSYHTKVPHKAIMRYILHYTDPGDIVFDGFCGTGMTGVAAQLCSDKAAVEALGYTVKSDGRILDENGKPFSRLGARKVVLNDLSPAATFIAYNYNTPADAHTFEREATRILKEVETEYGWLYETWHPHFDHPNMAKGKINFIIWSDVFVCPYCGSEFVFGKVALNNKIKKVKNTWECENCGSRLSKSASKSTGALKPERAMEAFFDQDLGTTVYRVKQVPIKIIYSIGNKRYEKEPDQNDFDLWNKSLDVRGTNSFPTNPMMFKGSNWGDTWRAGIHSGITNIHHFFTRRNLIILSRVYEKIQKSSSSKLLMFWFTGSLRIFKQNVKT